MMPFRCAATVLGGRRHLAIGGQLVGGVLIVIGRADVEVGGDDGEVSDEQAPLKGDTGKHHPPRPPTEIDPDACRMRIGAGGRRSPPRPRVSFFNLNLNR